MTATERLMNLLNRGEVLRTWEVHHTALATALAKNLITVTTDCYAKLCPVEIGLREELGISKGVAIHDRH
jgi:hypothetical protein